jgi:hypothetical protein
MQAEGQIKQRERARLGIIERLVARKPAASAAPPDAVAASCANWKPTNADRHGQPWLVSGS